MTFCAGEFAKEDMKKEAMHHLYSAGASCGKNTAGHSATVGRKTLSMLLVESLSRLYSLELFLFGREFQHLDPAHEDELVIYFQVLVGVGIFTPVK